MEIGTSNARGAADWDLVEINEAYAATPLVSTLVLADGNRERAEKIRERTNVHGVPSLSAILWVRAGRGSS